MQWYYGVGDDIKGPIENKDLVRLVGSGEVRPETPVWSNHLGNWTPARKVAGLFEAASSDTSNKEAKHSLPSASVQPNQMGSQTPPAPGLSPSPQTAQGSSALAQMPGSAVHPQSHPIAPAQSQQPSLQQQLPATPQVGPQQPLGPQGPQNPQIGPANQTGLPHPGPGQAIGHQAPPNHSQPQPHPMPGKQGGDDVPRVETGALGLTSLHAPGQGGQSHPQPQSMPAPNPAGIPVPGSPAQAPAQHRQNPAGQAPGPDGPAGNMMAPPQNIVLNPSGIGVPGQEQPESESNSEAKASPGSSTLGLNPQQKQSDADSNEEDGEGGDFSLPVEDRNPPQKQEKKAPAPAPKGLEKLAAMKLQIISGVVGLVLLAGVLAAVDMFLLGGKMFGLGARAEGPYRYYPDSPQLVLDVNLQEILYDPVVAIKIDEVGGIGMVEQMMQSAVGVGPYDIKEVKVIASGLLPTAPEFVCIFTTAKKIPEEMLVEKFFGNDKPEKIGGRNVYDLPMQVNGKFVACVADERTFLLGDKKSIESVLSRKEDPQFDHRQLNLIEAADRSNAMVSSSFDFGLVQMLGQTAQDGPNKLVFDLLIDPGSTRSARMMALDAGIGAYEDGSGDTLDFSYRMGFDSEAGASSTLEAIRQLFDSMDQDEFSSMMGINDSKMAGKVHESVQLRQDGAAVVMDVSLPIEFYSQMLMQDMGSIPGF